MEIQANWKVPVENSLEAYHLAQVHAQTLGEDPGEERSVHEIGDGFTSFSTTHFASKSRLDRVLHGLEKLILWAIGRSHQGRYFHYHSYPHLLFSFTDALSLVQCILPTGPTRSRAVVRQFGVTGQTRVPLGAVTKLWGALGALITRRILAEDRVLYPSIQRGLEASPHRGVLGYGERRIHAFQGHILSEVKPSGSADRVSL
jgi:phenylpropionate dioxygenase-like ring-hydroxylating dioxygenase large terminal subunit